MEKKLSGLLVGIICLSFTGVAFALTPLEKLGKKIYEDPAYSANGNQSCQSCHHPKAQFSDPINRISPIYRPVSEGSHTGLFGGRNAPPAAYAAYSPELQWDGELFIGGLFWDGRATGRMEISGTEGLGAGPTGDPLADQAKGPFGNPVEMALEDDSDKNGLTTEQKVVGITTEKYAKEYKKAFKTDIANEYSVGVAYNRIAMAIAAFEKSRELNKFSSKFDLFRKKQKRKGVDVSTIMIDSSGGVISNLGNITSKVYTQEEIEGLALFNTESTQTTNDVFGGGGCSLCHPVPSNNATDAQSVFTDFSYDNLGIPVNRAIEDDLAKVQQPIDYGLGAMVDILETISPPNVKRVQRRQFRGSAEPKVDVAKDEIGKFKVSSLRNIAKTAPYGHNGFFPTLYDIVHFYNTRDEGGWPRSEVPKTVNADELGNLGLTFAEEQKIVVFLETLTDE